MTVSTKFEVDTTIRCLVIALLLLIRYEENKRRKKKKIETTWQKYNGLLYSMGRP